MASIDEQFIKELKNQIAEGDTDEVLEALKKFFEPTISDDYYNEIIMQTGRYNGLMKDVRRGLLTPDQAMVKRNQLNYALLDLMDEALRKSKRKKNPKSAPATNIPLVSNDTQGVNFEKVIGSSNLNSISWLEIGMQVAKSVGKVKLPRGSGTGFLLQGGYLMTNQHVLSSAAVVKSSSVQFDYEEDPSGKVKSQSIYQLDPDSYVAYPDPLDMAIVRVLPNPNEPPIENWGFLELAVTPPPVDEYVTIIQHPMGRPKEVSFDRIQDVTPPILKYFTDTEAGSSGSPVFNNDWKVVALHHGANRESNQGTLIQAILDQLGPDYPFV